MPPEGMAVDSARFPRSWCKAVAAKMQGEISTAHIQLLQARGEVAEIVRKQPNFPVMLSVLEPLTRAPIWDAKIFCDEISGVEKLSSCCRFQ